MPSPAGVFLLLASSRPAPALRAMAEDPSGWEVAAKAVFPVVAFLALAPVLWVFFGRTWRELDAEAHLHQGRVLAAGKFDRRPAVLFAITALVLTLQQYYGGREIFETFLRPWLREIELAELIAPGGLGRFVDVRRWGELYGYAWWSFTRVFGYVAIPFVAWKIFFPGDSVLDMGLRARGLMKHAWVYGLCLMVVVPALFVVASAPDFGTYYPFYKQSSRSWLDLALWEGIYFAQFFGLEIFFRGFWLSTLRKSMGSGAIFAMCVPYCMIHFGKPYLEAAGAVVAGIALGSLAMRTRSIYSGFFLHVTVALLMDVVSLANRGALPTELFPPK